MEFKYRGVSFGGRTGQILVTGFDPGAVEINSQDADRPQGDGILPGKDFFRGRTWGFDLVTNAKSLAGTLAADKALASAWAAEEIRLNPGRTEALQYLLDGRWRRVYGRPGRYQGPKGDVRAKQGVGQITADFRVMDPLYYDETEKVVVLNIVPGGTGGLIAPLVAPLTTERSGAVRAGLITNTGDAPTPLTVTFHGPVTNPWVRATAGWEIGLSGTLAYDETVTVDARARTVTRNTGTSAPGMLTRATQLTASRLPVGPSEVTFGGVDPSGTAYAELRWRPASTSI